MCKQAPTEPTFTIKKVEMFLVVMNYVDDNGEPVEMESSPCFTEEEANAAIERAKEVLSYKPLIREIKTPEGL